MGADILTIKTSFTKAERERENEGLRLLLFLLYIRMAFFSLPRSPTLQFFSLVLSSLALQLPTHFWLVILEETCWIDLWHSKYWPVGYKLDSFFFLFTLPEWASCHETCCADVSFFSICDRTRQVILCHVRHWIVCFPRSLSSRPFLVVAGVSESFGAVSLTYPSLLSNRVDLDTIGSDESTASVNRNFSSVRIIHSREREREKREPASTTTQKTIRIDDEEERIVLGAWHEQNVMPAGEGDNLAERVFQRSLF